MPRFRKPPASFAIRTGIPRDQVVWRFSRTPEVERAFTAAHAIDDPAARGTALLAAMVEALRDWEGVLDEEGRPLPYSPEAFFQYVPAALRAQVLSRWIAMMLGAPEAVQPAAQEPDGEQPEVDDVGEAPDGDELANAGVPPPQVASGGLTTEELDRRSAQQLAFALPLASPIARQTPEPYDPSLRRDQPAPAAPPSADSTDAAGRQATDVLSDQRPPEAPTRASAGRPSGTSPPDSGRRVAQATSLRPLSPARSEQTSPAATTQVTPSAPPAQLRLLEAEPPVAPPADSPPLPAPCGTEVCPLLDPDFDWEPLIRPAWEALHKQMRREETTEAAF